MYPSVQNLPLSKDRIQQVITEIIDSFRECAKGRKLIKPVFLESEDARREETGFVSFGFNHILDKIWFVDGVFGDTSYSSWGMGRGYGEGIAEAENEHIVKSVLNECNERKIEFSGKIRPSDILRSLELLQESRMNGKIIFTDIESHMQLWRYRNLQVHGRLCVPREFSGYDQEIEVVYARKLPEGTVIIADAERLGELLIKESIENTASVSEIEDSEKQQILERIHTLEPEMLPEKVKLRVYETIKVRILNPNATMILRKKGADTLGQVLEI